MRRIGIRLWLVGAFAAVTLLPAGVVYLFGDRARAVLAPIALGVLAGFLIAVGTSHRVTRLSRAAGELAAGDFDVQLDSGARDEIGDLARSLESMRASLKESVGVLTADRNKLQAIFDGLTDAVIVVDQGGTVRFSHPAAADLPGPPRLSPRLDPAAPEARRRHRLRRPPGAAHRRSRLRGNRPRPAERARRAGGRPRSHRRDAARARRSGRHI